MIQYVPIIRIAVKAVYIVTIAKSISISRCNSIMKKKNKLINQSDRFYFITSSGIHTLAATAAAAAAADPPHFLLIPISVVVLQHIPVHVVEAF